MIIRKVRVTAAPETAGTEFLIDLGTEPGEWRINGVQLAEGAGCANVDWGDGTSERIAAEQTPFGHAYRRGGRYRVRIDDTIAALQLAWGTDDPDDAARLVEFRVRAERLKSIGNGVFRGCTRLTRVEILSDSYPQIRRADFKDCVSLAGIIRLPSVRSIAYTEATKPFAGCTGGIEEIHFRADVEEAFRSKDVFVRDPTMGSGTARCVFDL